MKNIVDLRDQLAEVFGGLRSGKISPEIASQLNNSAGKIIKSIQVEIEYNRARKQVPKIDFMEHVNDE